MSATIPISNIHCTSCIAQISFLLSDQPISHLSTSIILGSISFVPLPDDEKDEEEILRGVRKVLGEGGFDLEGLEGVKGDLGEGKVESRKGRWWDLTSWIRLGSREGYFRVEEEEERRIPEEELRRIHRISCKACQGSSSRSSVDLEEVIVTSGDGTREEDGREYETTILITGMTCSTCLSAVRSSLLSNPSVRPSSTITLLPGRAVIRHSNGVTREELVELIEEGGYEAILGETRLRGGWMESRFLIEGMSCSSCVNSLKTSLSSTAHPGIRSATITLLPPSAWIIHDPSLVTIAQLSKEIEESGFGSVLVSSVSIGSEGAGEQRGERKVMLRIGGMYCEKCSTAINHLLTNTSAIISFTPLSLANSTTTLIYIPSPSCTLRTLKSSIESLGPFSVQPIRQSTLHATLARQSQAKESLDLTTRVSIAFLFALPTILLSLLILTLLPPTSLLRRYFETESWGSASRGTILLWILATPVQFGVGGLFYQRSWKGLRGLWRRDGEGKWGRRFLRFGSMDLLVCLGTSTAYFSSLLFLILDILTPPNPLDNGISPSPMSYFDTCVILILFILVGRLLEGIARKSTGEAIEKLGSMASGTALLYEEDGMDVGEFGGEGGGGRTETLLVDFLEIGDVILIPPGSTVPLDSTLHFFSPSSTFDESSITGESLPILKKPLEAIIAGSINLGPAAVRARVDRSVGEGLIDGIVEGVRNAMGKKAKLEKFADQVTSYFVPVIVGIALLTLSFWIIRGATGTLPTRWYAQNGQDGKWGLFAVQFAVAVLVVACPCGIGLAVPSATMSATGIASRNGIVPYGGGEAFQNATQIDCVVFDKTGTLTTGVFDVVDHLLFGSTSTTRDAKEGILVDLAEGQEGTSKERMSEESFWRVLEAVEETSLHPIAIGLRTFSRQQLQLDRTSVNPSVRIVHSSEIPGRGTKALVECGGVEVEIIVGNEEFMGDCAAVYPSFVEEEEGRRSVLDWSNEGKSIILVATRKDKSTPFLITALISLQDLPRPEAAYLISTLQSSGKAVFICSGDNIRTARAIGEKVGLREEEVFAGLLPDGKRDMIERLQRGGARGVLGRLRAERRGWRKFLRWKKVDERRARVLFVGDGINDLLALTAADVGVSIGSGSTIAISTSDFCLLTPNLLTLLTLLSLAQQTRLKILSNFIWATGFNLLLIPFAAGLFYDYGGESLSPVWASAAMAGSSISVLVNSLSLRWTFSPPTAVRNYRPLQ